MPHRRTDGEAFGGIDDGVGVHAVVAVEVVDSAGLAEMFDAQSLDTMAAHAAEPAQRRRMAVDHGDDAAIARQRRQQFFDVAGMFRPAESERMNLRSPENRSLLPRPVKGERSE